MKLGKLKLSGKELRALSRDELVALDKVREAFAEAEEQIKLYQGALDRRLGAVLRLRSYAVVALGFERLLIREYTVR
ncbi:MAG: hypothetical protein GY856_10840 [bacterium]|nr:hypothetical protein [bacterium]